MNDELKKLREENQGLVETVAELRELLKHSRSEDIVIKNLQIARLESRIKDLEYLEQDMQSYVDALNSLREQCAQLHNEIQKKDKIIAELRGVKGTNLRNAGRKRLQELWKEKVFACWRDGMKDKDIYGWITCTDEKGNFHMLSQATYYRIKARYYASGEWKKED